MNHFSVDHRPSKDGAVWHVISPEGTCVWRTADIEEARAERDRRNVAIGFSEDDEAVSA